MTENILEQGLREAAEEGWTDRRKQIELVNRVFRLDKAVLTTFTNNKGEEDESYVADITLDGESESEQFWLGGVMVMPQVAWLLKNDKLPIFLTLTQDATKKGSPYLLLPGEGKAIAPPSGHPELDRFIQCVRDNGLTTAKGNLDARAILKLLGVEVPKGTEPADAMTSYRREVEKRANVSGDVVYAVLLTELTAALALSEPEPEEIPFE